MTTLRALVTRLRAQSRGRRANRGLISLVVAACLVAWPRFADACPVCFGGDGADAGTFILTTALLTFTPFLVIGAIAYWAVRRLRQSEAEALAAERRDAIPSTVDVGAP